MNITKIQNVESILAVYENFGLAKNDKIPWKSSKDMIFYTFLHFLVSAFGKRRILYSPNHIKIICNSFLFLVFYFLEHISLVFHKHP